MRYFLKILLVASCLGQSPLVAGENGDHDFWDFDTKK